MNVKEALKWNTRVCAVYALGAWTMIGSLVYLKYLGHFDHIKERLEVEKRTNPNRDVYRPPDFKENFVPYSRRIYNFIKSLSGETGPEGDSK